MRYVPPTVNRSLPRKSCMKKSTPEESISDSRQSLGSILRRASFPMHHRVSGKSKSSESSNISSSESSRRLSATFLSLFDRLGSSCRLERNMTKEKQTVVQFGSVAIREYEVTASHHPGGRAGVPIEVRQFNF